MGLTAFAGFTNTQGYGLGFLVVVFWLFMAFFAVAGIVVLYLLVTGIVQAVLHKDTRRLKIGLLIIGAFILQAVAYVLTVN